jgi:pimeloyl-ACP methyl ester carboxylesterase
MLTVPIDYQDASVGTIQLPVIIHHATQNKLGMLFTNFGGPWADNISALQQFFTHATALVQNNYDVATFAPRGVAPNLINCLSDDIAAVNELQRELNLLYMNSALTTEIVYDKTVQQRKLCNYSPLEKYASRKNTVQDMDLFRQALQLDKIDYLGYSYGSRLGLAYLLKYPAHFKKMVLDSNAAPDNDFAAFITTFSSSTENVANHFFELCVVAGPNHCALYQNTSEQIKQEYVDLVSRAVALGGIPTSATYNRLLSKPVIM